MQTQSQGHTSRSWDSAMGDMAVLQTAVFFRLRFGGTLYSLSLKDNTLPH